ncbi:helix-turn-helix domain-containing protein [Chelativorans xinjiangense]|uniref:helix-turn-helix domain-containing protein n=1 Tax=Chelativorans xinjiangense TaxID=2681485 RepID=UPI0019157E64|nr:helix-turn-helix domain-containing protein [Chelativorans xinjiangense]
MADKTGWKRLSDMTDEQAEANALSDPENPPLDARALAAMKRMPRVAVIRRALRLTQQEFSARYHIPLGTLRDWEQGRSEPDQTSRAFLRVIAMEPEATARALAEQKVA